MSLPLLRATVAALLLLTLCACEVMDHDRGVDSCYCYSDVTGHPAATIGHKWKL